MARTQNRQALSSAIERLKGLANGDKALIAAPYTWSPDENASDKFGGDGILLGIHPDVPKILKEIGDSIPDGIMSIELKVPAGVNLDPVALDMLSEPQAIGHGMEDSGKAMRLGDSEDCMIKAISATYDNDPDLQSAMLRVSETDVAFVKIMYPKNTLHGKYEAEVSLSHEELEGLVKTAMDCRLDDVLEESGDMFINKDNATAPRP